MHIFKTSLENIFGRSSYEELLKKISGKGAFSKLFRRSLETFLENM